MLGAREADVENHSSTDNPAPSQPATIWMLPPTSTWKMDLACQLWPKHALCNQTITDIVFVWIKLVHSFIKSGRGEVQTMVTSSLLELSRSLPQWMGEGPGFATSRPGNGRGHRKNPCQGHHFSQIRWPSALWTQLLIYDFSAAEVCSRRILLPRSLWAAWGIDFIFPNRPVAPKFGWMLWDGTRGS